MEKSSPADSRRMYSWWWDSHISPKNSKWLQENLTDMDAKVKAMIKLIEEDADSFARRAEMYYKKRPELMKLVEELYRAYRALAERYDHATGVIRHAHKTMAEAFPNQVSLIFNDDSSATIASGTDLQMPDELQMEYSFDAKRNSTVTEDSEKDESLELIAKLEKKLEEAEGEARKLNERVERAETDVEILKQSVSKLSEEKESAVLQYQTCLLTISSLETKLSSAQEEIDKFKRSNQSHHSELEALTLKMDKQNQELAEKNKEFGRLRASIQEEHLRFVEVEIAFKTLQQMHGKAQEELRSLNSELQNRVQLLKDLETHNQRLNDELMKLQEENKKLNELNLSSSMLIRNIQDEISSLREAKGKLEKEVEIQVDQRNSLQQEIRCLKEGISDLEVKSKSLEDSCRILMSEKCEHEHSIQMSEKQMACLKSEMHLLQEECQWRKKEYEEMTSILEEKEREEKLLELQKENLNSKLMNLQVAYDNLDRENLNLHKEHRSLRDEFSFLKEKRNILEQENYVFCGEILSLDSLSLVFKNCMKEKSLQLKTLVSDINKLHKVYGEATEKLNSTNWMLEETKIENLKLVKTLQKLEDELNTLKLVNNQLNHDIEIGNGFLVEKELKLEEIRQKLSLTENERSELYQNLEHLRSEHNEANQTTVLQQKQIVALSAECNHLSIENGNLHEENGKTKKQKEELHSELTKQISEMHKLESETEKLFRELQMYICYNVLYEQKFSELTAACSPAIVSLSKCISSLEKHTFGLLHESDNEVNLVASSHFGDNPRENESSITTDVVSDLHGMQARVQAIKKALSEMKHIEESKSKRHVHRKRSNLRSVVLEEEKGMLTKDIMLDQISNCSPFSTGKPESVEADNHTLELWDTTDWNRSIGLTVCKAKLADPPITGKNSNSRCKSVKKLEVSTRSMDLQEKNKRKVLERLYSDIQKLTNLQITVQDLKSKLETIEKSKRGKAIHECKTLMLQLNDAMASINKLFDRSGKLMQNLEGGSSSSSVMSSAMELVENESVGRNRISEQARRVSQKVGLLQLEVQKVQFSLLKLDEERDCASKTRISEEKRRVLLRDYLYGVRTRESRRKATCCACCVQPPTQED